jgi:hypothetical protein
MLRTYDTATGVFGQWIRHISFLCFITIRRIEDFGFLHWGHGLLPSGMAHCRIVFNLFYSVYTPIVTGLLGRQMRFSSYHARWIRAFCYSTLDWHVKARRSREEGVGNESVMGTRHANIEHRT